MVESFRCPESSIRTAHWAISCKKLRGGVVVEDRWVDKRRGPIQWTPLEVNCWMPVNDSLQGTVVRYGCGGGLIRDYWDEQSHERNHEDPSGGAHLRSCKFDCGHACGREYDVEDCKSLISALGVADYSCRAIERFPLA